jgi:hypothetical protein
MGYSCSRCFLESLSVKFKLTGRWPSVFLLGVTEDQIQFTSDMKRIFLLWMLVPFVTICSCQKQESAAEQQLAQRKVELDAREEALAERKSALDEREKALAQRERALAERERAMTAARTTPAIVQPQTPVPAPLQADTDPRLQQLPPEARALIPDRSAVRAQKRREKEERERLAPTQPGLGQLQNQIQQPMDKAAIMSGAAASLEAKSPEAEATSPSPSPTPQ